MYDPDRMTPAETALYFSALVGSDVATSTLPGVWRIDAAELAGDAVAVRLSRGESTATLHISEYWHTGGRTRLTTGTTRRERGRWRGGLASPRRVGMQDTRLVVLVRGA